MKTKNLINRYCVRKNCHERIYFHNLEAIEKRLCVAHYETWLKNKQKRTGKKKKCAFCQEVLKKTRNKKYSSVQCRRANLRLIDDEIVLSITKTPAWQRVERLLRKSPLGLKSINNLEDLFHLYIYKFYECSYDNQKKQEKLLAMLELNNIQSIDDKGKNTLNNLIITPKIKSTVPVKQFLYTTINYDDKPFVIRKSLLSALLKTKYYTKEDIIALCKLISTEVKSIQSHDRSHYMRYQPSDRKFNIVLRNPFLYDAKKYYKDGEFRILYCCLLEQLEHFNNEFCKKLRERLLKLFDKTVNLAPLLRVQFFELTALAIFHALLNYDDGNIIGFIKNTELRDKNSIEKLFNQIVKYINHNFALSLTQEIENIEGFIKFYKQFFTGNISNLIYDNIEKINLYRNEDGKMYKKRLQKKYS